MKIKVLIVDDHLVVRNGIKLMLDTQTAFDAAYEEAEDGLQAIKMAQKKKYDVIILDVNMPKRDGVTVAKTLIKENPECKILALTMFNDLSTIKQITGAGVRGYILKNSGIEELTQAVKIVHKGGSYFSNEVSQVMMNPKKAVTEKKRKPKLDVVKFDSTLTAREKEIINLITNEYTSAEIASRLDISKRTVEGHRNTIFKKLQVKNSIGIAKYAVQHGLD
ncbi:MAG: response regulator transcription factor [Bacteroidia bacterium]|nr:response regulator transcription factor [Bacteroidia bacterium]